jgi:hypothetical protein
MPGRMGTGCSMEAGREERTKRETENISVDKTVNGRDRTGQDRTSQGAWNRPGSEQPNLGRQDKEQKGEQMN